LAEVLFQDLLQSRTPKTPPRQAGPTGDRVNLKQRLTPNPPRLSKPVVAGSIPAAPTILHFQSLPAARHKLQICPKWYGRMAFFGFVGAMALSSLCWALMYLKIFHGAKP
jgi:hypothetical protein